MKIGRSHCGNKPRKPDLLRYRIAEEFILNTRFTKCVCHESKKKWTDIGPYNYIYHIRSYYMD